MRTFGKLWHVLIFFIQCTWGGATLFTAADCTGSAVIAPSGGSGAVAVLGAAIAGLNAECIFTVGAPGAVTAVTNLANGGDPGYTFFELYGATSA